MLGDAHLMSQNDSKYDQVAISAFASRTISPAMAMRIATTYEHLQKDEQPNMPIPNSLEPTRQAVPAKVRVIHQQGYRKRANDYQI